MNFYAISGLINGLVSSFMGVFVYFKNPHGQVNKSYGFLSLSLAVWSYSYFLWQISHDYASAFGWIRLLSIGAVFIPIFFLNFVFSLLSLQKKKSKVLLGGYCLAILFIPLTFTRLFISGLSPKMSFSYWPNAGGIYFLFLVFFFANVICACYSMFKAYIKPDGMEYERNQIKYVLIASAIGFLGGATNYPLWYNIRLLPVGNILVSVHVVVLAYAIIRYRLMDIKVTITRTGIFAAVYSLVMGLPFFLAFCCKERLVGLLGVNWWAAPLISMAILATGGPFIYIFLQKRAEAILLREQHRYQEALRKTVKEMTRILNLEKLLNLIIDVITDTVGISHSAIYLFDLVKKQYRLRAGRNLTEEQPLVIDEKSALIEWLESRKEPLLYEEIKRGIRGVSSVFDPEEISREIQALDASLVVPSLLENRMIGFLILGEKRSGKMYNSEDLDVFSVLANQSALAVENALLYENIEDKVKQRTTELLEVQKQLIQVEKLATIGTLAGGVAHEINNPLTAILTNVQMLIADSENLDSDSKESLDLIEEATKRCRTIVQKLMAYAKKPLVSAETAEVKEVNAANVVEKAVAFLRYQLEQENIKVTVEANDGKFLVMGNQNELEQVITNIILNGRDAIKQVKEKGVIHIAVFEPEDWVIIRIKDDGAGIPKEIITKVFDPFFTTKEVGKGLGLGLSICQSIIEKHNGLISVQSETGKGTVFKIKIPKLKENALKTAL
ncbi:MAG: ATP-binding protein [Candidatus Omnitrophota bacterium]|jgi:two-component system nitrogen regulation sensor histidine kinase GlnL